MRLAAASAATAARDAALAEGRRLEARRRRFGPRPTSALLADARDEETLAALREAHTRGKRRGRAEEADDVALAQRAVDAALAAQKCAVDERTQSRRELAQTAAAARDELAAARRPWTRTARRSPRGAASRPANPARRRLAQSRQPATKAREAASVEEAERLETQRQALETEASSWWSGSEPSRPRPRS